MVGTYTFTKHLVNENIRYFFWSGVTMKKIDISDAVNEEKLGTANLTTFCPADCRRKSRGN